MSWIERDGQDPSGDSDSAEKDSKGRMTCRECGKKYYPPHTNPVLCRDCWKKATGHDWRAEEDS